MFTFSSCLAWLTATESKDEEVSVKLVRQTGFHYICGEEGVMVYMLC